MGDYLVTLFQQWWSAVPIDWRLAQAGRTPSLLLTQEECEVNLSLLPGNAFNHLKFAKHKHDAYGNISSYFKEMLNAPVQSPYMLFRWVNFTHFHTFCACVGEEWKRTVIFALNALTCAAVNEHLLTQVQPAQVSSWLSSESLLVTGLVANYIFKRITKLFCKSQLQGGPKWLIVLSTHAQKSTGIYPSGRFVLSSHIY